MQGHNSKPAKGKVLSPAEKSVSREIERIRGMGYVFLPTRDGLRIVKPDKPPAEGPVLLERLKGEAPVVLKLLRDPIPEPVLTVIQRIIDDDPAAPGTEDHLFRQLARLCDPGMLKAYAELSASHPIRLHIFAEIVWLTEPSYAREKARRREALQEAQEDAAKLERLVQLSARLARHGLPLGSLDPVALRADAKALREHKPKPMVMIDAGMAGEDNPKTAFIRQVLAGVMHLMADLAPEAPIDEAMLRAVRHATLALAVPGEDARAGEVRSKDVRLNEVRRIYEKLAQEVT